MLRLTRRDGLVSVAGLAGLTVLAGAASAAISVEAEVMDFRKRVVDAIRAKDADKLRAYYAEDYMHAHGGGGVDDRAARIDAFLADRGSPIETLPIEDFKLRTYGRDTAIATGKGPFLNQAEGRTRTVRWTVVYVRTKAGWTTASSHATILPLS